MTKISHDSEVLAVGQQVITACAFIHCEIDGVRKVFLPKRAVTKKFLPNIYEMPGGHIDYGEEMVAGLKRELMEEFGVEVKVGDPFAAFTYTNAVKGSHSIEVVYFAKLIGPPEDITLNPEDHSSYGWFSELEIEGVYSQQSGKDDPEYAIARKGFGLLRGELPEF